MSPRQRPLSLSERSRLDPFVVATGDGALGDRHEPEVHVLGRSCVLDLEADLVELEPERVAHERDGVGEHDRRAVGLLACRRVVGIVREPDRELRLRRRVAGGVDRLEHRHLVDAVACGGRHDGEQFGEAWAHLQVPATTPPGLFCLPEVDDEVTVDGLGLRVVEVEGSRIQKLEIEWNERAKADKHFKTLTHPINFNPGIIKGGDWASSVPAWCDVDCRIAVLPGWSVAECQKEILTCVSAASRDHRFLSNNPPEVVWSGFLSEGYELTNSAEPEAAFGKAFAAVYGGQVKDLVFTALTDTRFYGLNYNIPSLCFGASGEAIHGFNEFVDLESLRKSTKATALFIAEWCGVEKG